MYFAEVYIVASSDFISSKFVDQYYYYINSFKPLVTFYISWNHFSRGSLIFSWGKESNSHCVKSVRIRSCSSPHSPAFGLNTEIYGVFLLIKAECLKMRTRVTPNTDTFHAVLVAWNGILLAISVNVRRNQKLEKIKTAWITRIF